ncbi:MAG: hypothetical protein INQ03_25155 [Candidatus Heimdallarchaeota archaeon]|nr:hypothetical protein [Candidatus Heimdallarchaeota archaeon]
MLTKDHLNVLLALIRQPTSNINKIKAYLDEAGIDMSYYAVKKSYEELFSLKILRQQQDFVDPVVPGRKRLLTEVEGNYKPEVLGLVRHHVIFKQVPNKQMVERFKIACDEHPYTHYRTMLLGAGMNCYAQFDVPKDAELDMMDFYKDLKKYIKANALVKINHSISTYSELKMNLYDPNENRWKFKIFKSKGKSDEISLEETWEQMDKVKPVNFKKSKSLIDSLKDIELNLIRELTINANVKAADIQEHYNKDRTTISRYLGKLKKEVMGEPTLYYDRLKFDMNSPQIIIGKISDQHVLDTLHTLFELGKFPFRSELISDQYHFLLILMVPPSLAPEIGYFIWELQQDIETYSVSVSVEAAWRYPFYPVNYDITTRSWRTDKEYINDSIISKIADI